MKRNFIPKKLVIIIACFVIIAGGLYSTTFILQSNYPNQVSQAVNPLDVQKAFAQSGGVTWFLKVEPITTPPLGNSQVDGHVNETEISSFSWTATTNAEEGGANESSAVGGSGQSKPVLSDLTIYKSLDQATPTLFKSLVLGTHYTKMTLSGTRASEGNPITFMAIVLSNVTITGDTIKASEDGNASEAVTINYGQIAFSYSAQNPDGSSGQPVQYCYDRVAVKTC